MGATRMNDATAAADLVVLSAGAILLETVLLLGVSVTIWPWYAEVIHGRRIRTQAPSVPTQRSRSDRESLLFYGLMLCIVAVAAAAQYTALDFTIGLGIFGYFFGYNVLVGIYLRRATTRSIADQLAWLHHHGLPAGAVVILGRERALTNLTAGVFVATTSMALVLPVSGIWQPHSWQFAAASAAILALISTPMMVIGLYLLSRHRQHDRLLRHLSRACAPEQQPPSRWLEPTTTRTTTMAQLSLDGLPPERRELLAAIHPLREVLRRRARQWKGLDQKALLSSAQYVADDLAELAASDAPIYGSRAVTQAVQLAYLGKTELLTSWAKPHDLASHAAWNPWTLRKTFGAVTLVVSTLTGLIALFRGLNP